MAFAITEREREGIVILGIKGRLTAGETNPVREKITELIEAGKTKIIFDLAHVEYIDSTGLGGLVICYTQLKRAGGALKLMRLNRRNVELLALTRLHTVFEVFAEEQDAINSFFPDREIKRFDILAFVQEHQHESGKPGA
jgi:anti-sigma B factor antagonist